MSDKKAEHNINDSYEIISVRVPAKISAMMEALSKINLAAKSSMFTNDISKFIYDVISKEKNFEIISIAESIINKTSQENHEKSFIELLVKNNMIYSEGNEK